MNKINLTILREQLSLVEVAVTANKEIIDQSNCLVFRKGRVWSYDSELCASSPSTLKLECAVPYKFFANILGKMQVEEAEYDFTDGELLLTAHRARAKFRVESEIKLPLDTVEQPEHWKDLDDGFTKALDVVLPVAEGSMKNARMLLTCTHFHTNYVEAFDGNKLSDT